MNSKFVVLAILALTSSAWATCDHPYSPAALGMSWTYSESANGSNVEYRMHVINTDTQGHATEILTNTTNNRAKVSCQTNGSLIIAKYFSFFTLTGLVIKGGSVLYSGVSIPAPNLWVIGTQWTYASTFKSISVYPIQDSNSIDLTVETATEKVHSKIVGSELVSVPAGEFTALKVVSTVNSYRTVTQNRLSTISKETTTETVWYARGVGIVKQSGKDYTITLTKFVKP